MLITTFPQRCYITFPSEMSRHETSPEKSVSKATPVKQLSIVPRWTPNVIKRHYGLSFYFFHCMCWQDVFYTLDSNTESIEEFSGIEQPPLLEQIKRILDEYRNDVQIIKVITDFMFVCLRDLRQFQKTFFVKCCLVWHLNRLTWITQQFILLRCAASNPRIPEDLIQLWETNDH